MIAQSKNNGRHSQSGMAGSGASGVVDEVRDRFGTTVEEMSRQIVENPLRSLGVALALGVFVGWLIKRR